MKEGFDFKEIELKCERCGEIVVGWSKTRRFCKDCARKRDAEKKLETYHLKKKS